MSSPPADLGVSVDVVPAAFTADDLLAEFAAVMREWGFAPFANPGSPRVCGPAAMLTRHEAQIAAEALAEFAV
jgi:hypothetical protein